MARFSPASSFLPSLEAVSSIAKKAGEKALLVRQKGLKIKTKQDGSRVCNADILCEQEILSALEELSPSIAVISEEQQSTLSSVYQTLPSLYYLVDPIDGTEVFINGEKEFCINIALICEGCPIMGVIYQPATKKLYQAFNQSPRRDDDKIAYTEYLQFCSVVVSGWKLKRSKVIEDLLACTKTVEQYLWCHAACKFGFLLEERAQVYPSLYPLHYWDTAAGIALLEAAGGVSVHLHTSLPVRYHTPSLITQPFLAFSPAVVAKRRNALS